MRSILIASLAAVTLGCGASAPARGPGARAATPEPGALKEYGRAELTTFDSKKVGAEFVSYQYTPGLAVAVVRRRTAPDMRVYGVLGTEDPRPVDARTYFPIGSITKVFTGLVLATAVERGEVKLSDTLGALVPTLRMKDGAEKQITLGHLITHRSGLPRLAPDMLGAAEDDDPYAHMDTKRLLAALGKTKLDHAPGTTYAYSNFGVAVLGLVLETRLGRPYAALLEERVLGPLGLKEITLDPDLHRTAREHVVGDEVPHWNTRAHAPAGGLYATLDAMAKFAAAVLDPPRGTEIGRALDLSVGSQAGDGTSEAQTRIGYAWHFQDWNAWHNGATAGSSAALVVNRLDGVAAVTLSNAALSEAVTLFNFALVKEATGKDVEFALDPPNDYRSRRTVPFTAADAARITGEYRLAPGFTITVSFDKAQGRLFVRGTNQPRIRLFRASEDTYFLKAVVAEGRFVFKHKGARASALRWTQNGQTTEAKRIR